MSYPARIDYKNPDAGQLERGGKYILFLRNSHGTSGVILSDSKTELWRFETRPKRAPSNFLRKPTHFILSDTQQGEILQITRERGFPARFNIVEKDRVIGKVTLRTILRNKYSIEFNGGPGWLFHMRLFTIFFSGESSSALCVWVRVGPTKRQWNLLVEPEVDNVYLLGALAFIHREWWCYS
jgi:hypothetical protein